MHAPAGFLIPGGPLCPPPFKPASFRRWATETVTTRSVTRPDRLRRRGPVALRRGTAPKPVVPMLRRPQTALRMMMPAGARHQMVMSRLTSRLNWPRLWRPSSWGKDLLASLMWTSRRLGRKVGPPALKC